MPVFKRDANCCIDTSSFMLIPEVVKKLEKNCRANQVDIDTLKRIYTKKNEGEVFPLALKYEIAKFTRVVDGKDEFAYNGIYVACDPVSGASFVKAEEDNWMILGCGDSQSPQIIYDKKERASINGEKILRSSSEVIDSLIIGRAESILMMKISKQLSTNQSIKVTKEMIEEARIESELFWGDKKAERGTIHDVLVDKRIYDLDLSVDSVGREELEIFFN